MDVAAVAYYSLVELSHKKRGSYVAGLTDVDKKVADTSFPERPLEAIDSFRSRMTEASLASREADNGSPLRSMAAMSAAVNFSPPAMIRPDIFIDNL